MKPQEVVKFFGGQTAAAKALGIKQPSVAGWIADNRIPVPRQFQIEVVTGGKLRAERIEEAA